MFLIMLALMLVITVTVYSAPARKHGQGLKRHFSTDSLSRLAMVIGWPSGVGASSMAGLTHGPTSISRGTEQAQSKAPPLRASGVQVSSPLVEAHAP